jgi:phosphohistidine phosphatase SixA
MFKRFSALLFSCLICSTAFSADPADNGDIWSALKSGRYLVLIRHAVTEPGIGDPSNFTIGDCSTQRNLSPKGRADAKRIGEAFRSREIPVADVLSSRWCRCIDTAQLAFGRVTPAPMLDSMFNDPNRAGGEKVRDVFAYAARQSSRTGNGNLILVTHAQNIHALTGVSPSSGEMIVVTLDEPAKFKLIGRIDVPDR